MTKQTAADYFKENHYVVIQNFISKDTASFLYDYVKMAADRLAFAEYQVPNFDKEVYGTFEDEQAPGDYSKYGDPTFDTLLAHKLPDMENFTGKKLIPTYSYHRLYTTDTELKRHKDRPSCEISTTLNLGGDAWPIFIDPTGSNNVIDEYKEIHKPGAPKGIKVDLKPGDMLIYSGCELEHWREPFEGQLCGQVFLHYNHADGQFAKSNLYDKRPMLGIVK